MKKFMAILLAAAVVLVLFAACGGNTDNGGNDTNAGTSYADATAVLDAAWAKYTEGLGEDEKFATVGGFDYENSTGAGALDVADTESLVGTFGFPEAETAKIDGASSIMHAMNGNVFTAVAFHVAEGADMAAIAESYKTALTEKQWFCGQPDGYALIKVDAEYMIAVYAQQPLEGFKTAALAALAGSEVVAEGSFAA
ncbi:MAG: hypothetical protein IKV21_01915 [Clostridia bacterium]|nr:hypothetical protein [Clostridia bacterium]